MSMMRRIRQALTLAAVLVGLVAATTTAAHAAAGSDRLTRNQTLTANQSIRSGDGRFVLVQQGDGNLVEYQNGKALWASNTAGRPGSRTVMQGDGNLVVYSSSNSALWSSRTAGTAADTLIVQNDGNVVIYGAGRAWWASRGGRIAGPVQTAPTGGAGPQGFDQRRAADAGLREVGTTRPTGYDKPGECIKSVQRWIRAAGGSMAGGGPVSVYRNSPAALVASGSGATTKAAKGDVIQYTSNSSPDSYNGGVHTVMVVANNGNGTLWIVQSNSPYGSGRVTEVRSWRPTPPAGFTANLWRFGRIS